VAAEIGADLKRLDADLQSGTPAGRVEADLEESRKFRFDGVPVFVVNGRVIEGAQPVEAFVELIDSIR
jgi:predicted DsbA family dithiol-disulfide isomerase